MKLQLLVWLAGVQMAACEFYPSIHWIPLNPLLSENATSLKVKLMSKMYIVCPSPVSIITTVKDNTAVELLYENLWSVTEEGFRNCDASKGKLLMRCDTPMQLKYYPVVFQLYSGTVGGLEFQRGKEYYFIATSDGTKSSLSNLRGGHCNNGLMKLKVYVCNVGYDERCSPKPTTTASTITTQEPKPVTQAPSSVMDLQKSPGVSGPRGNGGTKGMFSGRPQGDRGVASHVDEEKVRVKCGSTMMQVRIKKNVIEDFELRDLSLRQDKGCPSNRWESKLYFFLEVPFVGCGTQLRETNSSLVYGNMVKDRESQVPHINRLPQLEIPFSCSYNKLAKVSLVTVDVRKPRVVQIIPDDGVGGFTLAMTLFTSEDYLERQQRFPTSVTINERLYFQVAVDTPDRRLSIIADACYATPTSNGSVDSRHYIIQDRCSKDRTLEIHPSPSGTQRFSFQAFQFVKSHDKPFIYVHCKVLVCNASDPVSRCATGCNSILQRLRREVDASFGYSLDEGPIQIIDSKKRPYRADQVIQEEAASEVTGKIALIVIATVCILLICGVIYTRQLLNRARREREKRLQVQAQL